jgi:hypothetical protein
MVTSDSNRTQASVTPTFERQTQVPPMPGTVTEQTWVPQPAAAPLYYPIRLTSLVVAGATIGSMWGLTALVLAIIGLSGGAPAYLLPVAGITVGLALVMLGGIGIAWARMFRLTEHAARWDRTVFFGGVTAVFITGLVGTILGLLGLTFTVGAWFIPLAVIVLGFGLLFHSGTMRHVSRFIHQGMEGRRPSGLLAINALSLAPARDFLVGLVSAILGILAMLGIAPVALGFVAMLVLGGAITLTASTICGATLAGLESTCAKG